MRLAALGDWVYRAVFEVRDQLGGAWPEVAFEVYEATASSLPVVSVSWCDGPTVAQVRARLGARFSATVSVSAPEVTSEAEFDLVRLERTHSPNLVLHAAFDYLDATGHLYDPDDRELSSPRSLHRAWDHMSGVLPALDATCLDAGRSRRVQLAAALACDAADGGTEPEDLDVDVVFRWLCAGGLATVDALLD